MTGSPIGTYSITHRRTSLSRPALTSSSQFIGTSIGEWCAMSSALGSIMSFIGGPSIMGRGWCSHVLKVLEL